MANRSSSKEKNKKIVLAVLFAMLAVVVVWRFFLSGPEPRTRRTSRPEADQIASAPSKNPEAAPVRRRVGSADDQQAFLEQLSDTTPLNLGDIGNGFAETKIGTRGNIFAYYVKPPPQPVVPKPPPITLQFMQPQSAVAETPRAFTLTVTGKDFPADPQIIFDGRARPTKRVNDTTLTTEIAPTDYSSARPINVEVKSQSEPAKFYSNPISFQVQAPPEPPFKYIGRLGDQGLFEIAGTKEFKRVKRGETLQGVWRVDAISDAAADVTHTGYEIKRRLPMQDKGR